MAQQFCCITFATAKSMRRFRRQTLRGHTTQSRRCAVTLASRNSLHGCPNARRDFSQKYQENGAHVEAYQGALSHFVLCCSYEVRGKAMTLEYTEFPDDKVVEIRLDGRITREDYDGCIDKLQSFIDTHGTVKLIEIIDSFTGFDPSTIWEGIKFDFRNIKHISHVAVVSDIGWISPASKAAGALISTQLRTFDMEHLDQARTWVRTV